MKITLEITDAEAAIIDAGLVVVADAYGRLAFALRGNKARFRECVQGRIAIAERLRGKLLVAKHGEKRAAEIIAERSKTPDAAELGDGEPVRRRGGVTCYGTEDKIPYCSGADCPEWEDCHGDKLRGYSGNASNWREGFVL